ncbi:MAG: Nif3-like dinuclear metal center hexameric protein [Pseudomonadota bacterium]
MASLEELTEYINSYLQIDRFKDYCPNGLQVEGKKDVHSVVTGVTASQALIDAALDKRADAILVHHGYFWRNEDPRITGMKKRRIAALLANDISLLAYHLPLDVHQDVGNNAQLAKRLNIQVDGVLRDHLQTVCGMIGHLEHPMTADAFKQHIDQSLQRTSTHIHAGTSNITTIGWCTGAGQNYIDVAAEHNLDAYISGEISEATTHSAREANIHYYAGGHHATERYGVQALAEHLAKQFGIEHEFVDVDNPA